MKLDCDNEILNPWVIACSARDLGKRKIASLELKGKPIVVFRGENGKIYALDAICSHMGTHLKNGLVVKNAIRCPLHHLRFGGDGACERSCGKLAYRQSTYPTKEYMGCVFVKIEESEYDSFPAFDHFNEANSVVRAGEPVTLDCSWLAIASNGFDMDHFQTVHQRGLVSKPKLDDSRKGVLQLDIESSVLGKGASDRFLKMISGDRLKIRIRSYLGNLITVESDTGKTRSALILNALPFEEGVIVKPVYIVPRTGWNLYDRLRIRIASWLLGSFIKKDVSIMDGMKYAPDFHEDESSILFRYLSFIRSHLALLRQ